MPLSRGLSRGLVVAVFLLVRRFESQFLQPLASVLGQRANLRMNCVLTRKSCLTCGTGMSRFDECRRPVLGTKSPS